MNVLVLDEELSFPPTSGKRLRTFHLLKRLAGRHRIRLIAWQQADPAEQAIAERGLRAVGIEPIVVPLRLPTKRGLGFAARLLANVVDPLPYSVRSHQGRAYAANVRVELGRELPDILHAEWTPYAETIRRVCPSVPWLVMAHNVETLIWERLADHEPHPLKRAYIRLQARKWRRFERRTFAAAPCMVAVSQADALRMNARRVVVVENGVDVEAIRPGVAARHRATVLLLGSLDWRANQDAARWMVSAVLPRLRTLVPDVRVQLVGRKPSDEMRRLVGPHVEVHGDVPEVMPFLHAATVLAVPLRIGGGSRLKILEAFAAGLPVVSTTIGAEGLSAEPGTHFLPADDVATFAEQLAAVIRQPTRFETMTTLAREQVVSRYSWDRHALTLEAVWQSLAR